MLVTAVRTSRDDVLIRWSWTLVAVTGIQIGLGVATVMLNVPKWFALTHQGVGIAVFLAALVITHRVTVPTQVGNGAETPPSLTETVS